MTQRSFHVVFERLSSIRHPKFQFVEPKAHDQANTLLLTWWAKGKRVHVHLEDNPSQWSAWILDRSKSGTGFQDWKLPADPNQAEELVTELLNSFDGVLGRIIEEVG